MTKITLNLLAEITSGKLKGDKLTEVSEIIFDSRSIASSPEQIFFALEGQINDGHNFITELYEKNVKNFVVSKYTKDFDNLKNANFIIVKNTLKALQDLALHIRQNFKNQLVAIIGSNGKTIVKEWLFQLLKDDFKIVKSPKSYNSQLGVPVSLSFLDNIYDIAFIEAGISQKKEMEKLEKTVKPDTVIFVSLGEAHQENFKTKTEKAREKMLMAKNAEMLIFSPDYPELQEVSKNIKAHKFTWSQIDKNADLYIPEIKKQKNKTEITALFNNKKISYKIPFSDDASIKNSIVCLAFISAKKLFHKKITERFEKLEPVEMRIEQKQGINNCLLINDSYNSDLISLKIALDNLNHKSLNENKTLILSDIHQSGINDKILYEKVAKYTKTAGINKFIGIGNALSENKKSFSQIPEKHFFKTTDEFLNSGLKYNFKNENILLKGARDFKFEKISDFLQLKKHRTVLEINTGALIHNLKYYKSLLKKNTKILVMVKALSYGSGTFEIAKLLQHNNINMLGVALTDEGIKLRQAGITTDIIVMNPDEDGFNGIIDYKLEPEIYNFSILNAFAQKVEKSAYTKIPIHIKLDTGMKRLGFCDFEIDKLIKKIKRHPKIYVKSIFSHLAASDEPDKDEFTKKQISKFQKISNKIIKNLGYKIDRHILNSAGIERFPEYQFETVRLGIGLYGFGFNQDKLMNVSTLKTKILQIKTVKKGETVGYGRKYKAGKNIKIAILPVGYADGYDRALSNGKGEVLINGKPCPVVGNVCMDMCMVDVSEANASEGDEAIIFGDKYPASKLAEKLNTIPYEIITGISERVKRIYVE